MKELLEFERWANKIINERTEDRPLARGQDIQYQASRMYPDRSPEQALQLFVSNKMADSEKMDFEQNKLINAQKRDNEKLRRSLGDLANELSDHERTAQDTEREVQRLRDLSSKLKPAGELQQNFVKASKQELAKMVSDLDSIKNQQQSDPEAIKKLEKEIAKAQQGQKTQDDIRKLTAILASAKDSEGISNDDLIARLEKTERETSEKGEILGRLEKTQEELLAKEKRFQKSLAKNAEKMNQWGNKFSELDNQIQGLENRASEVIERLDSANDDAEDKINRLAQLVHRLNPDIRQQAISTADPTVTDVSTTSDKDEVQDTWAQAANEPVSHDPEEPKPEIDPEKEIDSITDILNEPKKIAEDKRMTDDLEEKLMPKLINIYNYKYPEDLQQWSEQQLIEIIHRTIDGGLLIYYPEITKKHVYDYLERARRWLRKTKPAMPELPFDDEFGGRSPMSKPVPRQKITVSNNTKKPLSPMPDGPNYPPGPGPGFYNESLIKQYENHLTKLSGGW